MKTLALAFALSSLTTTYGFCQQPEPDITGNWACQVKCDGTRWPEDATRWPDLAGMRCVTGDRNPAIVQKAVGLLFYNECSSYPAALGKVTGPTTFEVFKWGVTGNIADNGNRLIFSNGAEWVKQ
jgi:hypothetical protein